MVLIPASSRSRGRKGESVFEGWLRRSRLGYMIVDQTPLSVPRAPKYIKRPDFLVGIVNTIVAIDVKARDFVDDCGIIELNEHEGFSCFQRCFGMPVWYAWYPDKGHERCLLFRNADIHDGHYRFLKNRQVLAIPADTMAEFDTMAVSFDMALFFASRDQ